MAFLSLNPGRAPIDADKRTISDERGNSYEVEEYTTKSPITDQFLRLARFLGCPLKDILTGVVAPFRSDECVGLSDQQKSGALALGWKFWVDPLRRHDLRLILACSKEAATLVVDITDASLEIETLAGWGNVKLRR